VTFFGTFYLASKGILFLTFTGITYFDWVFIILDLTMISIIIFDFIYIRINRRKYGKLKYILKRKSKRTQVIGFIFICFVFVFEFIINFILLREIKFVNGSVVFMVGMMALIYGNHNHEKEGLAEDCIYIWGSSVKWGNIGSYDLDNSILTLNVNRKVLGIKEKAKIPYVISVEEEKDIVEFVEGRINTYKKN
jgi:hypothetical protein